MQNEPNLKNEEMIVSSVTSTTTNNELPTMNYLKRTQTKPILPRNFKALFALGFFVLHIYVPDILLCPVNDHALKGDGQNQDVEKNLFDEAGAEQEAPTAI